MLDPSLDRTLPALTSRTRIALAIARGVAASRGDSDLTGTHIVIGMIREGENLAVGALQRAGVDIRRARVELDALLGPTTRPRPGEVAIPASTGESEMLARAVAECRRRQDNYLAPHHLLLALLRDPTDAVARTFSRHGFGIEGADRHLRGILDDTNVH